MLLCGCTSFTNKQKKVHKCILPGPLYTSQEDVAYLEGVPGSLERTSGEATCFCILDDTKHNMTLDCTEKIEGRTCPNVS